MNKRRRFKAKRARREAQLQRERETARRHVWVLTDSLPMPCRMDVLYGAGLWRPDWAVLVANV